ncbi:MAG TPA: hypothetical protein VGK34_10720 [Armatimonadota bacterium]|jgi:hypothetical protein
MHFILKSHALFAAAALVVLLAAPSGARAQDGLPGNINLVLENTRPLKFPRGNRLPLYVWPAMDAAGTTDAQTEEIVRKLDSRGIGLVMSWNPDEKEKSLDQALRVAAIQNKLGLPVNVNATQCMYSFFNGDPSTAHIGSDGKPFFDDSFHDSRKMGCPFTLDFRKAEIRARFEYFVNAYKKRKLPIDFIWTDWEVDGPIEWNGAWESSKKCTRCREHIRHIEDFTEFQNTLRSIRSDLQKTAYTDVVKAAFPDALIANYATYPNDGFRYWYDYFEDQAADGTPYKTDQKARYRQWANEFPQTGYTCAMPVVYTWYQTFNWYGFENSDYRWFYNMLLNATNACKSAPKGLPVISFVHWNTTAPPQNPDPSVKQLSEEKYQELLWHMLLRGTSGLYLWCEQNESAKEVRLLHEVYAESLEYKDFLEKGKPVTFDVPTWQGPVVSAIKLGNKVLVRRTDFDDTASPVSLKIGNETISIPRLEGKCRVITLEEKERYIPYP